MKRLAASIMVAARQNGYTVQENRQAVVGSIQEYYQLMQHMASMCHLDVWYQHIDLEQIMRMVRRKGRELIQKEEQKANRRTNEGVFPKLTEVIDRQYRIKDEPQLIVHFVDQGDVKKTQEYEAAWIKDYLAAYLKTLPDDR